MTKTKLLLALASAGIIAAAVPASAQTAQESARFRAAQDRFDRESQIFRQESERYRLAAARRGNNRQYDPRYDDQRYQDSRYPQSQYPQSQYREAPYNDTRDEQGYDASRYYRSGNNYQPRTLSSDERVYAGNDGRYYCKRSDGTTGLILGAAGGGILGNVIDGGKSRTVGTLLGGALGAVAGRSIEQSQQVRCQ